LGQTRQAQVRDIALAETDAQIAACFPTMAQLRPHLAEAEFVARVRRMQAQGYQLAFVSDGGQVRAVAGFRLTENLSAGRFLYVDDLVTDAAYRSQGCGARLLDWLRDYAQAQECQLLKLDSGVQRADAHRFYFAQRMHIAAYHFALPLEDTAG